MKKTIHPNTQYGKGSTRFYTAVPPQTSDGRSGGVPHWLITPLLPKPAVLATYKPEPSQGTPGTAQGLKESLSDVLAPDTGASAAWSAVDRLTNIHK